jgi:hypothetical protein
MSTMLCAPNWLPRIGLGPSSARGSSVQFSKGCGKEPDFSSERDLAGCVHHDSEEAECFHGLSDRAAAGHREL